MLISTSAGFTTSAETELLNEKSRTALKKSLNKKERREKKIILLFPAVGK